MTHHQYRYQYLISGTSIRYPVPPVSACRGVGARGGGAGGGPRTGNRSALRPGPGINSPPTGGPAWRAAWLVFATAHNHAPSLPHSQQSW